MRIHDEIILKAMKKNENKSERRNNYKVKYLKPNGKYEELTFSQYYDHSCDCYNPFHVNVYSESGDNIMSGCGPSIESSYNSLITQLIIYMTQYREEKAESNNNRKVTE